MTTPVKDHPGTRLKRPDESLFKRLTRQQLFIPIVALVLLVLFNLIADPSFFAISIKENSLGNPVLSGNIISVLDNASELVMLAIGMTLMTASSGGQDISVGACMAIAGSVILRMACGGQVTADTMQTPLFLAVLVGILVAIRYRPDQGSLKLDRIRSGLPHDIVHTRSFLVRPRDGEIQLESFWSVTAWRCSSTTANRRPARSSIPGRRLMPSPLRRAVLR